MSLLFTDRRCQAHIGTGDRCVASGVTKVKGKWLCGSHATYAKHASASLVRIEVGRCPSCGSSTEREQVKEEPLLRHGGYGAARRTITESCSNPTCRWWLTTDVSEERPA